jgi:hypothetical protein
VVVACWSPASQPAISYCPPAKKKRKKKTYKIARSRDCHEKRTLHRTSPAVRTLYVQFIGVWCIILGINSEYLLQILTHFPFKIAWFVRMVINITIIILDITHRPILYLKLNSTP